MARVLLDAEVEELRRLAKIGKATIEAFNHSHVPFASVRELVKWYENLEDKKDDKKD